MAAEVLKDNKLSIQQIENSLTEYNGSNDKLIITNNEIYISYCHSCKKLSLEKTDGCKCSVKTNIKLITNEIKKSDIISITIGTYYDLILSNNRDGMSICKYLLKYNIQKGKLIGKSLDLESTLIYDYQSKFFKCICNGTEIQLETFFRNEYPDIEVKYIRPNTYPAIHKFNYLINYYQPARNIIPFWELNVCKHVWEWTGLKEYYEYLTNIKYIIGKKCNIDYVVMKFVQKVRNGYSILEKLAKTKYKIFVLSLLNGEYNKGFECNYSIGNISISEFFNGNTKQVDKLIDWCSVDINSNKVMKMDTYNLAYRLCKLYDINKVKELLEMYPSSFITDNMELLAELKELGYNNPIKLLKYINEQFENASEYRNGLVRLRDYAKMCTDYEMQMYEYPRDLKKSHDEAAKRVETVKDRVSYEKYARRVEELIEGYEYSDDTYKIVIPESLYDITKEGKEMNHCVGSYTQKAAFGKTTILFLRKKKQIDIPYVTLEVTDKGLNQVKCYRDARLEDKEAINFIKNWCRVKKINIVSMY